MRPPYVMLVHQTFKSVDAFVSRTDADLLTAEVTAVIRFLTREPPESKRKMDFREAEWHTHLPHTAKEHEANVRRFKPKLVLLPRGAYAQDIIDQLGFVPTPNALLSPHCYFEYGNDGPSLVAFRIPERPKMHVFG